MGSLFTHAATFRSHGAGDWVRDATLRKRKRFAAFTRGKSVRPSYATFRKSRTER